MVRIALVGLGDIAQKAYLPLVCQHAAITPVLCSRNTAVLAALSQQYRVIERYSDVDAMLASAPDAVMLHSSTVSHFELARAVLEAGIALFIDKPICDNLADAEQLLALARAKNLPFMVGFNRRYAPLYQAPLGLSPDQCPTGAVQAMYYQKHRDRQSAPARQLIFDDFIHLIDMLVVSAGLRHLDDVQISYHFGGDNGLLQRVRLHVVERGREFTALMDRRAGASFERLEAFRQDHYWQIDNLRTGVHSVAGALQPLGFGDWVPTLTQRGFSAMLEDWLQQLHIGTANVERLEQYRLSHQIAELLTQQADAFLQQV